MRVIVEILVLLALTIFLLSLPVAASSFGAALRRIAAGAALAAVALWIGGATVAAIFRETPAIFNVVGFAVLSVISYAILELRNEPEEKEPWTNFRRASGKQPIRPHEPDRAIDAPEDQGHVR